MADLPMFGSGYSPAMIRALQQYQLGNTLAAGAAKQDATNGLGVLAKALQGALGGYLTTDAANTGADIERSNQDTMAQALRAAAGYKNPDTGEQMIAPDRQRLFDVLARNPNTVGKGLELQLADMKQQQDIAMEISKALAGKGIVRDPTTGAASAIPGYGPAVGSIKQSESFGEGLGKGNADLLTKPPLEIALGPIQAQNAALKAQAENPALIARAGGVKGAEEAAALPFVGPKAMAQAYGSGIGSSNANLAPAPESPGVPAGMNRGAAGAFSTETGQQTAQAPKSVREGETKLREEWNGLPQVKNYREAQTAYNGIVDASGRDTKAADLNIVYGLAKLFDPGSVVREGEQVLVRNTAALPEWLTGQINALNGGAALSPETRANVIAEAKSRMDVHQGMYDGIKNTYAGVANHYGFDPTRVFADTQSAAPPPALPKAPAAPAATTAPAAQPAVPSNGGTVAPPPQAPAARPAPGAPQVTMPVPPMPTREQAIEELRRRGVMP